MNPNTILVDIDGTIALRKDRGPFEWDRVGEDIPNYAIIELVLALHNARYEIVFISGRSSICRNATNIWLSQHVPIPHQLIMRNDGDYRPDEIIKKELVETYFPDLSLILFVIDDRTKVVNMWRKGLGLVCLQVNEGNF